MTVKCVDFFCGGGGMSAGMARAHVQVVAAIDNDAKCKETYEANHAGTPFLTKDITDYTPEELAVDAKVKTRDDNMIFIGCAPCQYWSIINAKNEGLKKKSLMSRNLLRDFLRFVEYFMPGYVLIENVRGIIKNQEESGLSELKRFLDDSGYKWDAKVVKVSDYGVPQTRQRYVLLASRNTKNGGIKLPAPRRGMPTVRDAIGHLPAIGAGDSDSTDSLHRSSRLSAGNIARLKLTPEGGAREHWAEHRDLLIDAYDDKPISFFRENYGRMSWDKPAPTITTRFYSIGCGRFGHPSQNRCISLREGAFLQTFPSSYKFKTTSFVNTAKIIGNAVPVKFAKALGRQIVKHAEGRQKNGRKR